MTAEEMWNQSGLTGEYDAWSFGDDADTLARLVKDGELPEAGAYNIILDSDEQAVCITRTTKVYVTPFSQVTAEHAFKEGEGDRSLAYWREVHKRFFTEELKEADLEFDEDMKLVCEEFETVYTG